ncbi:hypothetical protein lpari_00274 [Legionella parisiensis]|uniref:Ankyrin repeat protein n=2 Tax=Legionella parisiensis TaxID=45071 RepID=A0A1E5JW19_9GAMM|nr:hypothetical protein [Legionella parisiensis]OEH48665.1 hypothetical protein lpari_00274 [Legionella parisiensis]
MDHYPLNKSDVEKLQNILIDISAHVDNFNFLPLPEKLQTLSTEYILEGYAKGGHVHRVNEWLAQGGNIDAAFRGYKAANNQAEMSKLAALGATTEDDMHTKILNFASGFGYKPIGGFCLGHTSFISLKMLFLMDKLSSMTDIANFLNKQYFNPVCEAAKNEDNSALVETYNNQLQQQNGAFWKTKINSIKFNRIFEYFDAASLFTFPEGYRDLFKTPEMNPYLTNELLHLILPEHFRGKIENEMIGSVNYLSLQEYIKDLETLKACILKANTNVIIPLHIFTQQHSILITYDKDTDRWLCADMNQLPLKFYNTEATAQFIKNAFPTSGLAISYFVSEATKEAVSSIMNAWKETGAFKQNRELTTDRIQYKYHIPYSPPVTIPLFDMAVHANDVVTIKTLCEKFQQSPNTFVGIRSSNHPAYAAAHFGHYDTFKYLMEHPATSFRSLSLQSKLCNLVIKRADPEFLLVLLEHIIRKCEPSSIRQLIKDVLDDRSITDNAAFSFCQTLYKIDAENYKLNLEVPYDNFRGEQFKIQLAELTATAEQIRLN